MKNIKRLNERGALQFDAGGIILLLLAVVGVIVVVLALLGKL